MELSRRNFIQAMAATGALAGAMGLAACAPGNGATDMAATGEDEGTEAIEPSEVKSADIVVVGGGMSGLAAAVAASAEGNSVIVLEATAALGGNGLGTEGVFGCGSSLQKSQGIEFTFSEIIAKEAEFFNYRIDTLAWKDMVENSAGNIDWLMDNGVLIDHVDDYRGMGGFAGFHWWGGFVEDGYISKDGAKNGYITPMNAKAEEQGVEFLFETRALKLVMDNGAVAGIQAQRGDESWLQIDCKAVILATGGYVDSDEKLREIGMNPEGIVRKGTPGHNGDGFDMAMTAGGVDTRLKHCLMKEPGVVGHPFESALGAMGVRIGGPYLFVNQNAERFTNEDCTSLNQAYMGNVVATQPKVFAIVNQTVLEQIDATRTPGIIADAQAAMESGAEAYCADTLDELAGKLGVDAAALTETLDRYNTYCAQGKDDDFAKDPAQLVAMEEGPFWGFQMGENYFASLGGIATNRNFEVTDVDGNAIGGLYAVGADGCELYRETYTVMVPASCMANNINSGRQAGLNAIAYCKA